MAVYFFTGFPGFLCNRLIEELLERRNDVEKIYTLCLPQMSERAKTMKGEYIKKYGLPDGLIEILPGDITKDQLGLSGDVQVELKDTVTHVFHLAAVYDLAVPKDIAYKVNVEGTDHVNRLVESLSRLQKYIYFSTAYVAGTRTGILREDELIQPEKFKNFYEETKFEAERLVEDLKNRLPVTIIRPGIVKGHSVSGETEKFDGPYLFLNMMDRLRNLPVFPKLGKREAEINLVPVDYIVDAVLYLSHAEEAIGKTYHLTDPNPYKVPEIYDMLLQELAGKTSRGRIPLSVLRFFLSFSAIRTKLRIEKETIDYLTWLGKFDSSTAQKDLQEAGIICPDLKEQIPSMVRFYNEHKDDKNYHIPIR